MSAAVNEILSFPVTFKHVQKLRVAKALELGTCTAAEQQENVQIQPNKWSKKVKVYDGVPLVVRTDGGFQREVGTTGWVIYGDGGKEELVRGGNYDVGYTSN
jgi:hypothetical protein